MENLPKISIVIPFYNCPYIDQAIKSALRQTYLNREVIVVDDGSTQHTTLIKPFLNQIRYIRKENGGTASALNTGIQSSTGELIAWLSSDDVFLREKLAKQVKFMHETNADMVYTNFNLINENSVVFKKDVGLILTSKLDFFKQLQKSCPVNGSTVLIKKDIFSSVGWFDETLKYTQDYDMWIRMGVKYDLKGLNESLLNYRKHDNMGSKRFVEEQWKEIKAVQEKYKGILARLVQQRGRNR
ncbi:glycosyltransferase family 2 protein [Alteribacillus bidgolensis]|uniref:Glycosyltransferase involved in cell wall bisynthesis n=1 Tax=Alteribacillus bidgolensis TaxID=930129 RepID=A0A1G8I229_9BACI|nr:glycosyltransferase [Alteribacillus bidgolensis]SDI12958.1 Glycosyltransferase involved in cell wall bisynthesis [Alteribacillus bidgolensis]